jgi:hypothetical protein
MNAAGGDPDSGAIVSGPPLTEEERERILAEVERKRNLDPAELADIGAGGPCAEVHVSFGMTVGDGICVTWDGQKFALLNMFERGTGTPYAGIGAAGLITNAESSDELGGNAWCVGGGVGPGGADVCLNFTDDWKEPTGIWTISAGPSAGVGGDLHFTAVETTEVAAFTPDHDPIGEWLGEQLSNFTCDLNPRC